MTVGPTCQKTAKSQNALFFPSMSIHGLPEQESPRLQRRGTSANFTSAPLTGASRNLHRQKRLESCPLPRPPGTPASKARVGRGADLDNLAISCIQPVVRRDCKCQWVQQFLLQQRLRDSLPNLLNQQDRNVGLAPHHQRRVGSRVARRAVNLSSCQVSSSNIVRTRERLAPANRWLVHVASVTQHGCGLASQLAPRWWEHIVLGTDCRPARARGVGPVGRLAASGWRQCGQHHERDVA